MSIFRNEDEVIKALAEIWKDLNPRVKVNLASYKIDKEFEKWFKTTFTQLPQPEIDIITCQDAGRILHAHEVKYFRMTESGVNYPFYEGLGEALALLRFGFDGVTLLHVFDENIPIEQMNDFAKNMWNLLNQLQMSIFYEYYLARSDKKFDPQYAYTFKAPKLNPYLYNEESRKTISVIRGLLRIPSKP